MNQYPAMLLVIPIKRDLQQSFQNQNVENSVGLTLKSYVIVVGERLEML